MNFDAIIIGAGPGGASAALSLSRQGRSVAIIERSEFPRRKVCGEFISAVNLALLDRLGVGTRFRELAGPEVARLAFFAQGSGLYASMPAAADNAFGRALGRDVLDVLMLDAAQQAGASVFQPWRAIAIDRGPESTTVRIASKDDEQLLTAPLVIAAHGSWEPGQLPSNLEKRNQPRDFLGFKAHFAGGALPSDIMPLMVFPGGYGGMVWADQNRLSVSCCIRRDVLTRLRQGRDGVAAGQAVADHIFVNCPAARDAIGDGQLIGEWLAAGPIRPGIRPKLADGIFRVGNVAGESHPIIAEGISMALQSGWLLAEELQRHTVWDAMAIAEAGHNFERSWNRQFAMRIRAAAFLARLAIFPQSAALMRAVVSGFPSALSIGARLSGKTKALPGF